MKQNFRKFFKVVFSALLLVVMGCSHEVYEKPSPVSGKDYKVRVMSFDELSKEKSFMKIYRVANQKMRARYSNREGVSLKNEMF